MKFFQRIALSSCLVLTGFVIGQMDWSDSSQAVAQPQRKPDSEDILNIREAYSLLIDVQGNLETQDRHQSVLTVVNPLAVCSGGVRALEDLERGNGVDPVTFGALYAGLASPELANELAFNEQGKLMFRNKEIRLYSPKRMARLFRQYAEITERRQF